MSKFQVGDVLRIRQWEDMAEEFGEDYGGILCKGSFIESMRHLCGQKFTVSNIYPSDDIDAYESHERIEDGWFISEDMLEVFIEDVEPEDVDNNEFDLILQS